MLILMKKHILKSLRRLSKKSELDDFLKKYLEVSSGTDQKFINEQLLSLFPEKEITNSVLEWLKFGSEYEDVGKRASNHFHDPIRNTGMDNLI